MYGRRSYFLLLAMQRFSAKKIALAGIGAAIALGAVIASFYVPNLSLTFNIVAAAGIMLPLTMKYYREAVLAYVAVCGLGAIFANIHILSFVLIGGSYTIATVAMHNNRDKLKPVFAYLIRIAYSCFVFFVVYYLTDILFVNLEALNISLGSATITYLVLNLCFTAAFIVYDLLLRWGYDYAIPIVEKITRNMH